LEAYTNVYGRLPPAYITDEQGRPMHSWRVLILPFLEEKWLYDQYDFNEPWDGPHNRLLAKQIPLPYRCPSDASGSPTATSYLAVTGQETVWPGTDCTALSDVTDGLSETVAVVEVAGSGVNWMEPRDLPLTDFVKGANRPGGLGASSGHLNGCFAIFCDGNVDFLQNQITISTLKALAKRADGEPLPRDENGNLITY
jgi:hypothetical protein